MIRERFAAFLARLSDSVFSGRNRARIVIGTDRKDSVDSGYGDGGEDDPESAAIDIVAGFDGNSGDVSFSLDKSRIYVSGKSDPDDYAGVDKGEKVEGEASIINVSDNIYLKARNKTKIVGPNYSILFEGNDIKIETESNIELKVGSNVVRVTSSGIELDAGQGVSGNIITDLDTCVGTDPVTGTPILSTFKRPESIVTNRKVKVK